MPAVSLTPGMQVVALQLQEAGMMHGDVQSRLSSAIRDHHNANGGYGYYVNHSGDGETGDVVYSDGGTTKCAPYEISSLGGKSTTNINHDAAETVVPTVSYDCLADEDDHYATMEESYKADGLYTSLPLYERFISKAERSKASEDDFAGKGKSFPILKPADVGAAVHAMGRAGDKNVGMSTLKSRIIAIAKRKGWTKYLPKSWQGDSADSKESKILLDKQGNLVLCESAATLETIVLKEAKADYEIKLISPGPGSSAIYPAEVLKRDGPNVFKAGTHVYLNHPTSAEEAARPEGDVKNLAGVLSSGATYHESHAKGPGLYARMKVFQDHAQIVEEKAAHVGMSIRASGVAEAGKTGKGGLPILKELTSAESVDVVTRAGAGGMILTEAARSAANQQEVDMTETEVTKLVEKAVTAAVSAVTQTFTGQLTSLKEKGLKFDAREEGKRLLSEMNLTESARTMVLDNVLRFPLPEKDGALDTAKFTEAVNEEAKRVATVLSEAGVGSVRGFGASAPLLVMSDADRIAARERKKIDIEEAKHEQEEDEEVFARLLGSPTAGKNAALKGVA